MVEFGKIIWRSYADFQQKTEEVAPLQYKFP